MVSRRTPCGCLTLRHLTARQRRLSTRPILGFQKHITLAEKEPNVTIILHHLFTILARAELEVRSTPWNDISADQLDKVFDRFRKKASAIGEDLAEHLSEALNDDSLGDAVE